MYPTSSTVSTSKLSHETHESMSDSDVVKRTAEAADSVWIGFVNVRAPDGRIIPVHAPRVTYVNRSSLDDLDEDEISYTYDDSDRVILDHARLQTKEFIKPTAEDGVSWRAVRGFDYTQYGLVKIANLWVENRKDAIKNATVISTETGGCIIL